MKGGYQKSTKNEGTAVYMAQVDLPLDPVTGNRRQTCVAAPTMTALEAKVVALVNQQATGAYVQPDKPPLKRCLNRWLDRFDPRSRPHFATASSSASTSRHRRWAPSPWGS